MLFWYVRKYIPQAKICCFSNYRTCCVKCLCRFKNNGCSNPIKNYYSVHQTRMNKKGERICIYIHKQLEFK